MIRQRRGRPVTMDAIPPANPPMPLSSLLLAFSTALVWGFNYVVIAWGLRDTPPMLMAALRFGLAALPVVLVRPRPRLPVPWLAAYTLVNFVLQFWLLYGGMKAGVPAGLASLVVQVQVFMTMGLGAGFLGERARPGQWLGAAVAFAGVALVGLRLPSLGGGRGYWMILGAALCWAVVNHLVRHVGDVDLLALVGWCSLFAAPVMLALAAVLDGPAALARSVAHLSWRSLTLILYQAYPATLYAFCIWSYLVRRHSASAVAPMSTLVPVLSMALGAICLGEAVTAWKAAAAGLVLGGLALNQWALARAPEVQGLPAS